MTFFHSFEQKFKEISPFREQSEKGPYKNVFKRADKIFHTFFGTWGQRFGSGSGYFCRIRIRSFDPIKILIHQQNFWKILWHFYYTILKEQNDFLFL